MDPNFTIRDFDPVEATDADFRALNVFQSHLRAERTPDDGAVSLAETIRDETSRPTFLQVRQWLVHNGAGDKTIAQAIATVWDVPDNRHLAEFGIQVLPEYRRRGIAKALLPLVVDEIERHGRRVLMTTTTSKVPAGEAFMQRLGAELGLASYTNHLEIADLNRDLVREWIDRGRALEGDFELGLWDGPYPAAELEAIAQLQSVMNTAPRDNLDMQDSVTTVEHVQEWERGMLNRQVERWVLYVRERASGNLAGYTQVFWNPERPHLLQQGDTGVFPQYRSRGLGTWLKATMLDKVLRERPEVTRVRTGNAQSNAPMLAINFQLGFKPYVSVLNWQIPLDRVKAYVAGKV